ncbi:MAG: GNAT family N-acetyltransferase [Comamonadaceae bacterium]|jgi:putative acetyltransferase|nr:GNAT family N-acetyltransferase [Comamonadaceae bacterium]
MNTRILPLTEAHFERLHQVLDEVAREKRYLAMLQAAIAAAWAKGLTRIELTVRADNPNARALYERMGFAHEGLQRGAFRVDGQSVDSHAMALLRDATR